MVIGHIKRVKENEGLRQAWREQISEDKNEEVSSVN